jgi:hypothetical protein
MYILDSNYCGSLTCKKDYSHKSLEISFRNYSLIFSLIVSELPKILRLYGDALSIVLAYSFEEFSGLLAVFVV